MRLYNKSRAASIITPKLPVCQNWQQHPPKLIASEDIIFDWFILKYPRLFSIIDRSEWHFFLLAWLGNISIKLKWLCFAHDHCRLGNNTLKRADYRYGKAQQPSLPPPPYISKHFCILFVTWHGSTFYLAAQSICDMGQGLSIVQSKWILPPHVDMLKSQLFSSLGSNCVKWLQNACQIRIGEMAIKWAQYWRNLLGMAVNKFGYFI